MSFTVQLSYEEKIINALARLPRPRSDNVIQRNTREFEAIRGVLAPLYAELAEAKADVARALGWDKAEPWFAAVAQIHGQRDELAEAQAEVERLRKALEEIRRGRGPYSRDQLDHAINCIEHMKELARDALADAATPDKCPRCESPSPERHPATAWEGEVQICPHEWHSQQTNRSRLTPETEQAP